jgi:hypothetical protein
MDTAKKCLKCHGAMVQGFIPEFLTRSNVSVAGWREGAPKESVWLGFIQKPFRRQLPIVAFRCSVCGFLELYADDK